MARPETIREDLWRALRSARLWHDASDEDIEQLARVATIAEYEKDDVIFHEGTCPAFVAVVVEGHARGVHETEGRTVVVETDWPGDVLGSVAALGDVALEADIQATGPITVALVPTTAFKALLAAKPAVAMSVINEITRSWVAAINVNKRNSADVISRVASYLMDLPKTRLGASAYAVEIPISRVELAASLGTTPETLSRAFHTLQAEGLIESHDRMIIVSDGDALGSRRDGIRPTSEVVNGGRR